MTHFQNIAVLDFLSHGVAPFFVDLYSRDNIWDRPAQVAAGRGMSVEAVRKAAGGRVYTGKQALAAGFVDAHGE
eukprot:scaffold25442_cov19-Tisochrysis_lutea.AAC.1